MIRFLKQIIIDAISRLFSQNPALLYGLSAFIGSCFALYHFSIFMFALFGLILSLLFLLIHYEGRHAKQSHLIGDENANLTWITWKSLNLRLILAIVLGSSVFCFSKGYYQIPYEHEKDLSGIAYVKLTSITHKKTPFGLIWTYHGVLQSLTTKPDYSFSKSKNIARNLPIDLTWSSNTSTIRPLAGYTYRLKSRLKNPGTGRYALTVHKDNEWKPLEKIWSLAEWRLKAKKQLKQHIQHVIRDTSTASFLSGIASGDVDDRYLAFELGRFGLQHLMAISGLHFAILASLLGLLLRMLFSWKLSALIVVAALSLYFLFLGPSPSVIRAWIAITIALTASLLEKRTTALNSLGIALLVMSIGDPFSAGSIGFQFSFAVTGSILIWHAPCDALLQCIFAKRRLSQIAEMNVLDQHGYCLLYFIRQGLALALAVNLAALPLTLYHFHKFPIMSLIYNLFFPFMITLSMFMLIVAFLAEFTVPLLAEAIHLVNESYTQFLLNFVFNLPRSFDFAIRMAAFPSEILIVYFSVIFTLGIVVNDFVHLKPNLSPKF